MSARRPPSAGTSPVETRTGGAGVASGKPPNSSVLAGREHELARIDALMGDAAEGRSGALLVVGEPGVGKTTLLEVARARADSFTCLATRGIQAESHLAWAGLFGLLNPIRDRVADLTDPQASALGSALAWSSGAATADPFLLGAATLSLLAAAAEQRPVLVLVDDVQWLDPESAAAITFAARRLGPDAVAFLLAAREGTVPGGAQPRPAGSARRWPLPVRCGAASAPGAAPDVVKRLVAATQGNPLALLEVAARLDDAQWLGAAELPDPLPSGDRWREHFRTTLAELSPRLATPCCTWPWSGTRGRPRPPSVTALGDAGIDVGEALREACRRGALVEERAGYRIRHPLLRSAVLELATPERAARSPRGARGGAARQ